MLATPPPESRGCGFEPAWRKSFDHNYPYLIVLIIIALGFIIHVKLGLNSRSNRNVRYATQQTIQVKEDLTKNRRIAGSSAEELPQADKHNTTLTEEIACRRPAVEDEFCACPRSRY